jgi:hypothetical protein
LADHRARHGFSCWYDRRRTWMGAGSVASVFFVFVVFVGKKISSSFVIARTRDSLLLTK